MERKMGRRWDRMVMDSHGGRRRRVVDGDGGRRRLGRSRRRGPGQPPRPPPRRVWRRRAGAFSGRPGRPWRRERRENVEEADALLGHSQDVALRVRARGEAREAREVRNRVVIVICLVDDKPRRVDEIPEQGRRLDDLPLRPAEAHPVEGPRVELVDARLDDGPGVPPRTMTVAVDLDTLAITKFSLSSQRFFFFLRRPDEDTALRKQGAPSRRPL